MTTVIDTASVIVEPELDALLARGVESYPVTVEDGLVVVQMPDR